MSELFCITLDGVRYAIRGERVLSRQRVSTLHRLPFADPRGGVIAMLGERPETLADLSVCLGHSPTPGAGVINALVMADEPPVRGFVVGGELVEATGPHGALIPMPQCLPGGTLEGFFLLDGQPVPVIDIEALFVAVRGGAWTAPRIPLILPQAPAAPCDPSFPYRVITAGGVQYALAGRRQWESARVNAVFHSPLLSNEIDGICVWEGTAFPVLDLGRRMGGSRAPSSLVVLASVGPASIAVLVDSDNGICEPGSAACRELPPLARPLGLCGVLQGPGEPAIMLDLGALISRGSGAAGGAGGGAAGGAAPQPPKHATASDFPSRFRHGDIEVQELVLLGMRHALPKSEVQAVVGRLPWRRIPLVPPFVAGVADYEGDLLPVLDLTSGFAGEARSTGGESMILLRNGDFHAFLLSERVLEERRVNEDDQRPVPYAASHPFLYGCYVDGAAVRLVFNIAAIAMQFSRQSGPEARNALAQAFGFKSESHMQGVLAGAPRPPTPPEPVTPLPPPPAAAVRTPAPAAAPASAAPEQVPASAAPEPVPAAAPREEQPVPPRPAPTAPPPPPPPAVATPPAEAAPKEETAPSAAPTAPELVSEEPQLQIPESAAGPAVTSPARPARAPVSGSDKRPDGSSARGSRLIRWLAGVVAALVVAAAAVILLVPAARAKVFPPATVRVEAPAAKAPTPAAAPAPSAPKPAEAAPAPAAEAAPKPAEPAPNEYVVVKGDTLAAIAKRFFGDSYQFQRIADENGIANPDLIFPDQKIRLLPK